MGERTTITRVTKARLEKMEDRLYAIAKQIRRLHGAAIVHGENEGVEKGLARARAHIDAAAAAMLDARVRARDQGGET